MSSEIADQFWENILSPKTIDIGIAAQVADGVMVPVLRLSLIHI